MRFATITLALSLAATSYAAPLGLSLRAPHGGHHHHGDDTAAATQVANTTTAVAAATSVAAVAAVSTEAAAVATPAAVAAGTTGASVLTVQDYNDFQVSDGVGGNALAEVNAKFPVDQNNLASVSAADLDIISKAAQVAEDAETGTGGFDDAIDAAGGTDTPAGSALQVGKIKNKVLKLQTDILRIQIETAQGNTDSTSELAGQQTKLATDVATDVANAGLTSTPVDFAGTD